jgi:hypothetical protein
MCCYVAAAGLLAAGYFLDQSTCIWRAVTGLPCPGCGMIHACLALARGDVRAAWQFNPNSFVVAPILAWTGIQRIRGGC